MENMDLFGHFDAKKWDFGQELVSQASEAELKMFERIFTTLGLNFGVVPFPMSLFWDLATCRNCPLYS